MQPNLGPPNGPPLSEPWQALSELPTDSALPALGSIRAVGLAAMLPELGLGDGPVAFRLCNYVVGSRATFEADAGGRRFAVKLFADDPTPEAELYQRLERIGLTRDFGARVPRLRAWDPDLRVLVIDWLEGPTLNRLIKDGQGERAGHLAGLWLWHANLRRVKLGPPRGRAHMLYQVGVSVGALNTVDRALGAAARGVARMLVRQKIREKSQRLVHATLYARHIFDLGDGPGVIDWHRSGQGPVEIDAGMFLASISRLALRRETVAREAASAGDAFLEQTRRLVDPRRLEWYWAAGLLHLAATGLKTGVKHVAGPETHDLLVEAQGHAERAMATGKVELGTMPIPSAPGRRRIEAPGKETVAQARETKEIGSTPVTPEDDGGESK